LTGQYANYSTGQESGIRDLNDTTRVRNVSQNITIAPRLTVRGESTLHMINLMVMTQSYEDQNRFTSRFSNTDAVTVAPSYSVTFLEKKMTFTGAANYTEATTGEITTGVLGITASASFTFLRNMFGWTVSAGFSSTSMREETIYQTFTLNSGIQYRASAFDTFTFNLINLNNSAVSSAGRTYNELNTNLTYSRRFSL
jgi:hypothetical protein